VSFEVKGSSGNLPPQSSTSAHPALAVTLRRSPKWRQISQALHGGRKDKGVTGMGGHFRAVMGFRYYGQAGVDALAGKEAQ
jgi:hypothetical protein